MESYIINNIGLIVALAIAVTGLIQSIITKNKQQVFARIYDLVSDAQQLADKTGLEKFNLVFDQVYNKLPKVLKFFITEDEIKRAIQYSFDKLKAFAKAESQSVTTENTKIN